MPLSTIEQIPGQEKCVLSPILFLLHADYIMSLMLKDWNDITIKGKKNSKFVFRGCITLIIERDTH